MAAGISPARGNRRGFGESLKPPGDDVTPDFFLVVSLSGSEAFEMRFGFVFGLT